MAFLYCFLLFCHHSFLINTTNNRNHRNQKNTPQMPNNEQNPEECDTTGDDSSNTAG